MLRDATTANLLGLAAGGVMDAFVVAFRIANLSRRLLGEGALATSYLPVLAAELERDREAALALAATVLTRLAAVLTLLVLAGEAICGLLWICSGPGDARLLVGLSAALLPYLWFICLAAQLRPRCKRWASFACRHWPPRCSTSAGWPAPGGWHRTWLKPPRAGPTRWPARSWLPERCKPAFNWPRSAGSVSAGLRKVSALPERQSRPARLATDRSPDGPDRAGSLGDAAQHAGRQRVGLAAHPAGRRTGGDRLAAGRDSLIRCVPGPRRRSITPNGSINCRSDCWAWRRRRSSFRNSVGTPLAATAAALARDLTSGLRLVVCLSLPAAVGLILLAEPLSRIVSCDTVRFMPDDVARTAATTRAYAAGVAAYCALPLLLRGFYAVGDARRPLCAALVALAINTVLDLALAWPLGESGLALATAISSLGATAAAGRRLLARSRAARLAALGACTARATSGHGGFGRGGAARLPCRRRSVGMESSPSDWRWQRSPADWPSSRCCGRSTAMNWPCSGRVRAGGRPFLEWRCHDRIDEAEPQPPVSAAMNYPPERRGRRQVSSLAP